MTEAGPVFMAEPLAQERAVDDGLEGMVREHSRLVFRIAYSVLRNHHDAEDAVQEVFLRILRTRERVAAVREPRLWLARIAWRVAIDRSRKRSPISLDDAVSEELRAAMRDPAAGTEQLVAGRQMMRVVEELVAALPGDLRDALVLSTVQELPTAAIAEILEVPEVTVRTRLFRARQILKQKLAARLGEGKGA
jgi:RNA polymerase sigma-70 factor (ECF subfamily)